jgi:hypothetical protein
VEEIAGRPERAWLFIDLLRPRPRARANTDAGRGGCAGVNWAHTTHRSGTETKKDAPRSCDQSSYACADPSCVPTTDAHSLKIRGATGHTERRVHYRQTTSS